MWAALAPLQARSIFETPDLFEIQSRAHDVEDGVLFNRPLARLGAI